MNFGIVDKLAVLTCGVLLVPTSGSWAAEKSNAKGKPVVRKMMGLKAPDLRSKIGQPCVVCHGPSDANAIAGVLVNASEKWIVVSQRYGTERTEYWFPVDNIRYISFDVSGKAKN